MHPMLARKMEIKIITPTPKVEETVEKIEPADEVNSFKETTKPPSIMGEPYVIDLFELGEAKNHFEMPSLLKEIDQFVMSEIERNKLDDSAKSYKEIIDHYLTKLNLPDNVDVYTKTEKVLELMKINKKLLDAAKEKEELLAKPVTELSSTQLKKRFEL